MTTGIQCQADPRCEVPAPPETAICRCHAKQAQKAGATIHRINCADRIESPQSRQADKELEP